MKFSDAARLTSVKLPAISRDARVLERSLTIDDLRGAAKRTLPRAVFDFIDGGADNELSMRNNAEAFTAASFVPKVLAGTLQPDTSIELFGRTMPAPFALAPTGFQGVVHATGEVGVAQGAAVHGVPYTLSMYANRTVEDVARNADVPLWFQAYLWKDMGITYDLIERARAQGTEVLVVTVDTTTYARRLRDARSGFTMPPEFTARTVLEMTRHPRWCASMLLGEPLEFAHLADTGRTREEAFDFALQQHKADASWEEVKQLRSRWDGPMVVKGLLDPDDVVRAQDLGAEGVVLSNHGGRQLDQAVAPIRVIGETRDRVGDSVRILIDSGIRRGHDIALSLAMGADACLIGRAFLYGFAAAGPAGVEHAITILRSELARLMGMIGTPSIRDLRDRGVSLLRDFEPSEAQQQ